MDKNSTSKLSLKLFRKAATKYDEKQRVLRPESVSAVSEDKSAINLHSEDVDVESETFCEFRPTEACNVKTEGFKSEQTGENDSPTNLKPVAEDEIADIFPPDSREEAVVVSWNWDSSQRNSSPKSENTKSTTPVGQKKRPSRICSPLMRGQPPTRRKKLLKKELTSTKSSFVSELRALSEKLQKAKECAQIDEGTDNDENELCFEISDSSTDKLDFRQDRTALILENVEKIKNESFRTLLEDVDDDCLIQCSQEVEQSLQECRSPLKKSPKILNLDIVKLDKSSPSRAKTPSKGRVLSNIAPRRSPRIRNQNPVVTHTGQSRNCASIEKSDRLLDEDLVESLLDDEIELLSQIPSPSTILNTEKRKLNMMNDDNMSDTTEMVSKEYLQSSLNDIVNLMAGPSCAASAQYLPSYFKDKRQFPVENQHVGRTCNRAVGIVKPTNSITTGNCFNVKKNYIVPKNNEALNIHEKDNAPNKCKEGRASTEDKVKSFDDSFGDPAFCTLLDSVESSILSCSTVGTSSPVKDDEKRAVQNQVPGSPPLRCTPEEIEKKKREALERRRRNHSHKNSIVNSKSVQPLQRCLLQEDKVKVKLQVPGSPPRRYTPEEIEKKRLEALQIKRQQSLLRSGGPRQRLHKK